MNITGEFFLGTQAVSGRDSFRARDPASGSELEPDFAIAGPADIVRACELAHEAFAAFRALGLDRRASFLEAIADNIAAIGDPLIERAMLETGLPRGRLEGERQRTINQLRLFAGVVRKGDWLSLRIDTAQPDRVPPRPDLRLRKIPLGPVAVFGASNFPLAFSVAGGDTASALAAGCPVVVKGHPAHPGVSELVARAIVRAVTDAGLPAGVFSLLAGPAPELGAALVANPRIRAVGFTGSRQAGLALCAVAAARPEPIPVYAEMSSVNPVFLLPGALEKPESLAPGFVQSLTLGAGQFCTNPGLVFGIAGDGFDTFIAAASNVLSESAPQTMLTAGIHAAYEQGVGSWSAAPGVALTARGAKAAGTHQACGALFVTDGETFLANPALAHETFGPAAIAVRVADGNALLAMADRLEGQLTASVHMSGADSALAARLLPRLELRAGRIIANGWPTGVEVAHAMVHGGPFPATSDGRTTSVGSLAIERFLRPVCYQDVPDALLPDVLRGSASAFERLVDGARIGPTSNQRP